MSLAKKSSKVSRRKSTVATVTYKDGDGPSAGGER